jgi:hypothetical protein
MPINNGIITAVHQPDFGPTRNHEHVCFLGPWNMNDLLANQGTPQASTFGDPTGSTGDARNAAVPFSGVIRAMGVTLSGARTAGSVQFHIFVNGASVTGANNENSLTISTNISSATGVNFNVRVNAGDLVQIRYTSDAAWTPTTSDARVTLWMSFPKLPH